MPGHFYILAYRPCRTGAVKLLNWVASPAFSVNLTEHNSNLSDV